MTKQPGPRMAVCEHGSIARHLFRLSSLELTSVRIKDVADPFGVQVSDLSEDIELLVFSSRKALSIRLGGVRCKVSLLVYEPKAIQKWVYWLLPLFWRRFHRVYTHCPDLVARLPNARKIVHSGTMVGLGRRDGGEKSARISVIASGKTSTIGHQLRHRIIKWSANNAPDMSILGSGYQPFDDKFDGHAPYRFSVVIENSQQQGYFTEKLIDAFLCNSVPIYWGDPDIETYFDPAGMLICKTEADIQRAVQAADKSLYNQMLPALLENKRRALALEKSELSINGLTGYGV